MKTKQIFLLTILLSHLLFSQSIQKYADIGNLQLENGLVIENCQIGFRTFGELNAEKNNAIIYCSWFGGASESIEKIIGNDKIVDTLNYFIIAFDALGNGVSTSPSNSISQPNEKFPNISIRDMVNAQHKVLVEHLGIENLFAAIGGSMGGMQVFEWLVAYPDFIKKAITYAATPKLTTNDLLIWQIQLELINHAHNTNTYEEINKIINKISELLVRTPEYLNNKYSPEKFEDLLKTLNIKPSKIFTSYNKALQIKAIMGHDISKYFSGSMDEAAKNIKTKLFIIVGKQDNLVNPAPAIEFAKVLNSEILILDNNCGHLAVGCELKRCSDAIKLFLKK